MKPSESRKPLSSKSKYRLRIGAALVCFGIGGGIGHELASKPRDERIQTLTEQLEGHTEELLECTRNNRSKAKALVAMRKKLNEVQESKERLNDWRVFLGGLRKGEEGRPVTQDEKLTECRDMEEFQREQKALAFLDYMGITNERDRQAVIDSYRQGCSVISVKNDGGLDMVQQGAPVCEVELEEPLNKNYVDVEHYAEGSTAERATLDRYRDKDYEGALAEYAPVLGEMRQIADANPSIKELPFYEDFSRGLDEVYKDFSKGNTIDGLCRIGHYLEILGDLEENPALNTFMEQEEDSEWLWAIMRKLDMFGDIAFDIAERDYPGKDFDSPEIREACAERGMAYTLPWAESAQEQD